MTVVPFAFAKYVRGSCNVTTNLPAEGNYTYRVTVVPGEVEVISSFVGSNEIRRPSATLHHNCPQYVLEGGQLDCTCFASDRGSPPGVLQWNTSQSAELTVSDIRAWNSGTYLCRLLWNNTLVQSVEYTLQLASPPSVPLIFALSDTIGEVAYPFIEGTSGTLYCQSNQTGRPEATYTWPVAASGHVSGSNLSFYHLTREDNGRPVKCRASNLYTENRQPVHDADFVLRVYYKPILIFKSVSNANDCSAAIASSAYTQCVVAQGRRVHINCTADSNPHPASFKWLDKNKDVFSNTSELVISSADQAIHDGDYSCTVLTVHDNTDSRLPLTASATFTVIVGHFPSVLDFSVNSPDNMTVHTENARVELKCAANGRPTPNIRLINASDPSPFLNQSEPKSALYVGNRTGEVTFSIDRVQCEASGVYRCEANNALGQDTQTQRLLVYCGPRGKNTNEKVPIIGATDSKGELSFTMTAYPTPAMKNITYLEGMVNPRRGDSSVKDNIIHAACSPSYLAPATVTCNVSVIDMKHADKGFYRTVFSNSLGEIAFIFFVEEDSQEGETDNKTAVIAVLAVMLTVVLVVNVVAVIWIWRRGLSLPCAGRGKHIEGAKDARMKPK